jgi:exonuclease VII large subunit
MAVNAENQLTQTSLDVEHQKELNKQTNILLEEMKEQMERKEKELNSLHSDLHHSMSEVHKKQGAVDSLQEKLQQLIAKSGVCVRQTNCCNICSSREREIIL